jgi:hypothetical protein
MKIVRLVLAIAMAWAILRMIEFRETGQAGLREWSGWRPFAVAVGVLLVYKVTRHVIVTRARRRREEASKFRGEVEE